MIIQYHSKLKTEFSTVPNGNRRCPLVEPFEFSVDSARFVVPAGFWTDFASVPRLLWPIISPYDLGIGPVPHDFGYFTGHANRAYWDMVLLACMEKDKIAGWKRSAAYRAVDLFAGSVWTRYRKENVNQQLFTIATTRKLEIIGWEKSLRPILPDQSGLSEKEQAWQKMGAELKLAA